MVGGPTDSDLDLRFIAEKSGIPKKAMALWTINDKGYYVSPKLEDQYDTYYQTLESKCQDLKFEQEGTKQLRVLATSVTNLRKAAQAAQKIQQIVDPSKQRESEIKAAKAKLKERMGKTAQAPARSQEELAKLQKDFTEKINNIDFTNPENQDNLQALYLGALKHKKLVGEGWSKLEQWRKEEDAHLEFRISDINVKDGIVELIISARKFYTKTNKADEIVRLGIISLTEKDFKGALKLFRPKNL